ncbi:unnamed protein product [Callosobruchus maculatus]|uniref:Peptidase M16 N-terminal domain-containing protein n=1 Tax=Callosobruchus maculatus TaxID=64391 RepID=A0A653CER0_CALMS|nr:unnamed protein product [Callosobruchus maculatus]
MASTLTKVPLLRTAAARSYSQALPVCGNPSPDLKSTVLQNKLVVATLENDSSIARISIVFRAGSRNETADSLGATHVLRTAAGLSTKNASQFAIIRNIQEVGASLTATSDRETIAYTLEGTKSAIEQALPFLTEVATQQVFKPWELADLSNRLKLDIATRTLPIRTVDLLHNAAFRSGLGNSLFIPKNKIGKISSETLQHYVASTFLSGRCAVVGSGVNHSHLTQYANALKLNNGSGCATPSPYKGGELRSNKGGDFAFVAIAGEGAPASNIKEALACAVLQRALGTGPHIKWSTHDNSILAKSIGTQPEGFASTAINVNYSDTGLVGVLVAAPAKCAKNIVQAAYNVMKCGSITDADVNRGKNQLKTQLLVDAECGGTAIHDIGIQAVLTGNPQTAAQLAAGVDSITAADVQSALKKAGQKLSVAAMGNLVDVPYMDELK